jgi:hypothetical protein
MKTEVGRNWYQSIHFDKLSFRQVSFSGPKWSINIFSFVGMYFRVCQLLQPKQGSLAPLEKPREETLLQWLHLIQPGLSVFNLSITTCTEFFI